MLTNDQVKAIRARAKYFNLPDEITEAILRCPFNEEELLTINIFHDHFKRGSSYDSTSFQHAFGMLNAPAGFYWDLSQELDRQIVAHCQQHRITPEIIYGQMSTSLSLKDGYATINKAVCANVDLPVIDFKRYVSLLMLALLVDEALFPKVTQQA